MMLDRVPAGASRGRITGLLALAVLAAGVASLAGVGKDEPASPARGAKTKEKRNVADQESPSAAPGTRRAPGTELPPEPFPRKFPAPSLEGGVEWLNTSGPITLESLHGKVVLLDFWTYCCINCMHVLPDLKKLEEKYANQLVVIGVHSAKFDTERDSQNIREAILRYEISHPVINDANMVLWRKFDVHAWPTLWIIDPEGNAVAYISGEGVYDVLDRAIGMLVKYHRAKKTLNETLVRFELERNRAPATALRFPGKVLADADSDRLFIADSNHNRIVVTTRAGKLLDTIGSGQLGRADGAFDAASFFRPQGLALVGDLLYIADTENHMLRRADLKTRQVATIAGTGEHGSSRSHRPMPARETSLNSPWDLAWVRDRLYIAMAGSHQIWVWEPDSDTVHAYAGSGREDIEDGDAASAALAQPSGLASDGKRLFVADSEVSAVRTVTLANAPVVRTVIGRGLFDFGDADGDANNALFQHPLGVAWSGDTLYVADTYNNKIKLVDPDRRSSRTVLGDGEPGAEDDPPRFDEPGGVSFAQGKLFIADTNNHAIRVADVRTGRVTTLALDGLAPPRPPLAASPAVFPNAVTLRVPSQTLPSSREATLRVRLNLADGYELNDQAPIAYRVETPEGRGLVRAEGIGKTQTLKKPAAVFDIPVTTGDAEGAEEVVVSLTYYQCRHGAGGICEVRSVIWKVPVQVTSSAKRDRIDLVAEPAASAQAKSAAIERQLEKP
jgi:thiol-disulfide isomerase/thioredoxin